LIVSETAETVIENTDPIEDAKELRRQLEEAKAARLAEAAAREAAEARAQAAHAEAQRAQQTSQLSRTDQVATSLSAAEARIVALKAASVEALRSGDFDKGADISVQLGELGADIARLKQEKAALENQRQQTLRQPAQAEDPKEAYIRQQSPKTQRWLRDNPAFFDDKRLQSRVIGAHHSAVGQGIEPESDEYFEFVEKAAGMRQERPEPQERRAASGSPVSRSVDYGSGAQRASSDVISPEMRHWAEVAGVDPVEYKREHDRLARESDYRSPFSGRR